MATGTTGTVRAELAGLTARIPRPRSTAQRQALRRPPATQLVPPGGTSVLPPTTTTATATTDAHGRCGRCQWLEESHPTPRVTWRGRVYEYFRQINSEGRRFDVLFCCHLLQQQASSRIGIRTPSLSRKREIEAVCRLKRQTCNLFRPSYPRFAVRTYSRYDQCSNTTR